MVEFVRLYPTIAVALIAAFGALIGGIVGAGAKFLFDFYLSESIKRRWATLYLMKKYSSPLIRAADDLAARLDNMNAYLPIDPGENWLRQISDDDRARMPFERYYFVTTVFLLARLISVIEVLKKEQEYLDFTSLKATREFNSYLNLVYAVLSSPGMTGKLQERTSNDHWIFFHYLAGIGDAVTVRDEGETASCMSFAKFSMAFKNRSDVDFSLWMREVERLFENLRKDDSDPRWARLRMLWYSLDRLLEFLDPKHLRTTRTLARSKSIGAPLVAIVRDRASKLGIKLAS